MRYYRCDEDGLLVSVGTGLGNTEITEAEYNEIMGIIKNRPRAESGFEYVLTSSLSWECREKAMVQRELTDSEALSIILGGGVL